MNIDKSRVKIGSDFEMFLENAKGKIVSAIPFNKGTKQRPEKLDKEGCCIQRDGVLQECNVPPVGLDGSQEFWDNIQYVKNFLTKKFTAEGIKLVCCASATLDDDQMQDEEALALGCDADFNAWEDGAINPKPNNANKNFRTCGGHIHMSYNDADCDVSLELVKLFDRFVVVPFILIDHDTDRRKLYGKAGSFRLQQWGDEYGVEFRQLSNKWLENKDLVEFLFHQLDAMIEYFNANGIGTLDGDKERIVKCINESDTQLAAQLCKEFNILLPLEYLKNGNMLELV